MISWLSSFSLGLASWNLRENLKRRRYLKTPQSAPGAQSWDTLTIAIPVRDEVLNLRELLPQILAQETQPFEWLFLDDGSSDGTRDLLAANAAPNLRIIDGSPLPEGWRGKVHALHQLEQQLRTPFVLFMDADVRLKDPRSLTALREESARQGFGQGDAGGFFSIFPQPTVGNAAGLLVHQVQTYLYYLLPSRAEEWGVRDAVAGCGQMMLMRIAEFRELGGFQQIANSTHDGLKCARLFAKAGRPVSFADGAEWISCESYTSFANAFRGYARNSFEGLGMSGTIAVSFVIFWIFVFPFVWAPFLALNPFFAAAFLALLWSQLQVAQEFGFGWSHVPLTPVKGSASIAVHLWSLVRELIGSPIVWHGRAV